MWRAWLVGLCCLTLARADEPYRLTRHVIHAFRALGDIQAEQLALSPDGQRLAFIEARYGGDCLPAVVVMDLAGHVAFTRDGRFCWPQWSPGGQRLLFGDEEGNLYTARPDGSDLAVRVRGAMFSEFVPSEFGWLPAGGRLLFGRESPRRLWCCEPDGARPRRLLAEYNGVSWRWCAAARWLACVGNAREADPYDPDRRRAAWLVDPASGRTELVPPPGDGWTVRSFDLSPDGRTLALFCLDGQGGAGVWLRARGARGSRRLWDTTGFGGRVKWSPDGETLVAVRKLAQSEQDYGGELGLWNAAGEKVCQPFEGGQPQWSPGGKRLL